MSETDELQQALDDLAGVQLVDNTWQEAEAVRREITGIIQALHRDLCAEASAACQEWDVKCQGLEAERDELRQQADRLRTAAIEGYGVMEKAEEAIHYLEALLDSRAGKLLRRGQYFISIADDEPYFEQAYNLIRDQEIVEGHWTEEDEQTYAARIRAWRGDGGEEEG